MPDPTTQSAIPEDLLSRYEWACDCIKQGTRVAATSTEFVKNLIERCARAETALADMTATMDRFVTEAEAVMDGELGNDWADHYGPLWERLQAAKDALLSQRERSK